MNIIDGGITSAKGFSAASFCAGIKSTAKDDMAMIVSDTPCLVAGTFTTNKVFAAPVKWDKKVVYESPCANAVVINSGIANACTGQKGDETCEAEASAVQSVLGFDKNTVLLASTGVIGMQLPVDKLTGGVEKMSKTLSDSLQAGTDACFYAAHWL